MTLFNEQAFWSVMPQKGDSHLFITETMAAQASYEFQSKPVYHKSLSQPKSIFERCSGVEKINWISLEKINVET